MTAPTITAAEQLSPGQELTISGRQAHYLLKVRRVQQGETVRVLTDQGVVAHATVVRVESYDLVLRIDGATPPPPRSEATLILVASGLKSGGTADLVAACAELGVDRLALTNMARSVAQLHQGKEDRLQRVATDAARKVAQTNALAIDLHDSLAAALDHYPDAQLFVLDEEALLPVDEVSLPECGEVLLCVGPEGGFEGHERQLLESVGALAVRLRGPAYRARTAALAGTVLFLSLMRRL